MATGRDLLGRHLYDILSPSAPEVLTLGNTSNNAFIRFYDSNIPSNGVLMGLSNNTFNIFKELFSNIHVGINTYIAKTTLDVNGIIATNKLTTFQSSSNIEVLQNLYLSSNIIQNSSSYIGFGTTLPKKKLDVVGDINFSDRLFHNGEEYRESQFRFLYGCNYELGLSNYMFSNVYYLNAVGIGTNSSNELVNYNLFVQGNAAINGKVYATDFVSYGGVAANSFLQVELFESGNERLKTILTNDTTLRNRILYSFTARPGRYLAFANIPYRNLSPYIFIDNQNWVEICLYRFTTPTTFTDDTEPFSLITLDIRGTSSTVATQNMEFFLDVLQETSYVIAVRGKGHLVEFGSLESSSMQLFAVKGIGNDDSFSVRKALQPSPIRHTKVITSLTSNFSFSTEGLYTAESSNVDVFINGVKYIYESPNVKDYDIIYGYDFASSPYRTNFSITLTEPVLTGDIISIAIWPYVTADTVFSSGYYYQNIVSYPSQWLNISGEPGVRYPHKVVIDGDLIIRGNFIAGCNTDVFSSGADTGSLTFTCNVVGTLNIIDGAINTAKLKTAAVTNEKILDSTILPTKFNMKNQILYVGCNYGELDQGLLVNRRGIIVEGDIYITGQLSASNIAGSRESVADNSLETRKYKDLSITYEKIALNSIGTDLIRNSAITKDKLALNSVLSSNILNQEITFDKMAINSVYRSNISPNSITSNEIDTFSITTNKMNFYLGNLGIGLSNQEALEKVHVYGNLLMDGNIRAHIDNIYDFGTRTKRYRDIYAARNVNINNTYLEGNTYEISGITVKDFFGRFGTCRVGNLITSNIGIGTETPGIGVDLNYGNLVIRNGALGIGTTVPRYTIDADNNGNSTMIIGNIGIGTQYLYNENAQLSIYGGFYMNNLSNETFIYNYYGNIGIGTDDATDKLTINNGDVSVQSGSVKILNGSLYINQNIDNDHDFKVNGNSYLNGNIEIQGNITTCNIVSTSLSNDIGESLRPFNNLYIKSITINPENDDNNIALKINSFEKYLGDNYTHTPITNIAYSTNYQPLVITKNTIFEANLDYYNFYPYRNLVINGNMRVEQRYTGSNIFIRQATDITQSYCLDRHFTDINNTTGMLIVSKSNIFNQSYMACRVGITTSTITATTNYSLLNHKIEGYMLANLNWGTSNAQPITVSFKLKSDVSTNLYLSLHNATRSRSFVREIVINQTAEPTLYSFIVPGDMYGTWSATNTCGLWLSIQNAIGTTYLVDSALSNRWLNTTHYGLTGGNVTTYAGVINSTIFITNLQVEAGTLPTTYEFRPFNLELDLCRRYFEKSYSYPNKLQTNTTEGMQMVQFPTTAATDTVAGTVQFKVPKCNSTWIGTFYSPSSTQDAGLLGIRTSTSPYAVINNAASVTYYSASTLFAVKSENNFNYHFNTATPSGTSRNLCFHWAVDAEI